MADNSYIVAVRHNDNRLTPLDTGTRFNIREARDRAEHLNKTESEYLKPLDADCFVAVNVAAFIY